MHMAGKVLLGRTTSCWIGRLFCKGDGVESGLRFNNFRWVDGERRQQ